MPRIEEEVAKDPPCLAALKLHYLRFLEYGEYPYVSTDEIKKALALKDAFASMLDRMQ